MPDVVPVAVVDWASRAETPPRKRMVVPASPRPAGPDEVEAVASTACSDWDDFAACSTKKTQEPAVVARDVTNQPMGLALELVVAPPCLQGSRET